MSNKDKEVPLGCKCSLHQFGLWEGLGREERGRGGRGEERGMGEGREKVVDLQLLTPLCSIFKPLFKTSHTYVRMYTHTHTRTHAHTHTHTHTYTHTHALSLPKTQV